MEAGTAPSGEELEREIAELLERDTFEPPAGFAERALVSDESPYEEAEADPEGWWAKQAEALDWAERWDTVLDESEAPFYKWFTGGTLNASHNCVDRHVEAGNGDRVAFHWRGEEGEERDVTYADLLRDVQRLANALKDRGIGKGDVVGIYLPMIPEVAVAMLACARIGAPHNVVFGGFSPGSVKERMEFSEAKALITTDSARRKGKTAPVKPAVDEFLGDLPSIETVVVVKNAGDDVEMTDGRDVWYHEALEAADAECPPEPLDAEHPLFVLYTSGSTAKPKGILHTTGGFLTGVAATTRLVFDLRPEEDVFWCSADVGWVTGHSYIVYGPLMNGATSVMYEGAPDYPAQGHLVGAVRPLRRHDLLHGAHGHPGLHQVGGRPPGPSRPVQAAAARVRRRADQPEGMGLVPPRDRRRRVPDRGHLVADRDGPHHDHHPAGAHGHEARIGRAAAARDRCRGGRRGGQRGRRRAGPPGAAAAVAGDAPHAVQGPGPVQGDLLLEVRAHHLLRGRRRAPDEDGYFWVIGRVDDVINVSGHRLSTAEVESAIVSHPKVAESAVIGQQDEDTGQAICAFVTLEGDLDGSDELIAEINEQVAGRIGKFARPKRIVWADDLPKTRSGKIMRRLLQRHRRGPRAGRRDHAARPRRDGAARGQGQGPPRRGRRVVRPAPDTEEGPRGAPRSAETFHQAQIICHLARRPSCHFHRQRPRTL